MNIEDIELPLTLSDVSNILKPSFKKSCVKTVSALLLPFVTCFNLNIITS